MIDPELVGAWRLITWEDRDLVAGTPPELLEGDVPRPFEVTGDTLVLGDQKTWRRTCQRI
jgi:hypothetical protein